MKDRHVCPVWLGYFLANPLRKVVENPSKNLSRLLREGMMVLDVGCAMGFYSIPMAEMVGPEGKVICVDLQEKMVTNLIRRARKKDLHHRIEARVCTETDLNLSDITGSVDFILAAAVLHEVPDPPSFFLQLRKVLREGGSLLLLEPGGHVSRERFRSTVVTAEKQGFLLREKGMRGLRRSALFGTAVERD
ncbi:MAG: class I SAM-dependent methyltransferase [Candidatus Fermentibacteraceae bacterium]|nr:class I SAM-dependent methyltransferase [Candidatus Fermentibacteraceae bacterium]